MTQRPTAPKAIGNMFKGAIGQMALQSWRVGHLDGAILLIDVVLDAAKENAAKFPKDKDCKEAVKALTAARDGIEDIATRLAHIAVGEK